MIKLITLIKNLFKIARVLSVDDSGSSRFATVSALGKEQKVLMFTPYGLMNNPPVDSLALLWNQQAQGSNGVAMADDPPNRTLKDLEEGEVALGNYLKGSYIYFTAFGKGILDVPSNLEFIVGGHSVSAITLSEFQTVGGNSYSEVTGDRIADAASFEFNGNGDNLVTWADLNTLLASYWAIYNGHVHGGSAGVSASVSFDITAAKATTLKTDG